MYCHARNSRGVALITALLLVALITVSVTAMSGDKNEGERNDSDSTEDFWAESLPPVPVDGATVEGCIIDLNGKFNLNNLVDEEGKPAEIEFEQLKLLLAALNIDSAKADAIRDWIDRDLDATGAQGAEDDFYTGQTPPYRAANGDMVSFPLCQQRHWSTLILRRPQCWHHLQSICCRCPINCVWWMMNTGRAIRAVRRAVVCLTRSPKEMINRPIRTPTPMPIRMRNRLVPRSTRVRNNLLTMPGRATRKTKTLIMFYWT